LQKEKVTPPQNPVRIADE